MYYLKLFESFIEEEENDLYSEITENEYNEYTFLSFRDIEKEKICRFLDKLKIKYDIQFETHNNVRSEYISVKKSNGYVYCKIHKIDDEWFIVDIVFHRFYKCDEIDGLIILLSEYMN